MSLFEFFGRSAATRCFSVRAVQLPRCFSCGQGSAAFRYFSGQQANRRRQVGGRHLPNVSYGHFLSQLPVSSEFNGLCTSGSHRFLPTLYQADLRVILAAQLSVRESHATRRIRFSVSDLFQK